MRHDKLLLGHAALFMTLRPFFGEEWAKDLSGNIAGYLQLREPTDEPNHEMIATSIQHLLDKRGMTFHVAALGRKDRSAVEYVAERAAYAWDAATADIPETSRLVVVVKPPSKPAVIVETDGALETLQSLVGGYIEALPGSLGKRLVMYVNEDGLGLGLQPNCEIDIGGAIYKIVGTLVLVGLDESGEHMSMPDAAAETIAKHVNQSTFFTEPKEKEPHG